MRNVLNEIVRGCFGQAASVAWSESVSGGDINEAYHLLLTGGEEVFLKLNARAAENFFSAEKYGLKCMKECGANVPEVLVAGKLSDGTGYLLLSYVRSSVRKQDYWTRLGYMLGGMHRAATGRFTKEGNFGLGRDNYIGATKQVNKPRAGWIEFFRENRLVFQLKLAEHYFDKEDKQRLRRILDHLEEFLTEPEFPSLLHGDLWGGNVMADSQGMPMLIDPAVYVGHHEAELAMTELFGGFDPAFYDAYHELIPREPGYADRRDLYNLYHLLNHLNLFGGSYLVSVRRILKRYA